MTPSPRLRDPLLPFSFATAGPAGAVSQNLGAPNTPPPRSTLLHAAADTRLSTCTISCPPFPQRGIASDRVPLLRLLLRVAVVLSVVVVAVVEVVAGVGVGVGVRQSSASPGDFGGGLTPPPPRTRISLWDKMKFANGNMDLGYFWCTNVWVFGFQDPPPPHLKRTLGSARGRVGGAHPPRRGARRNQQYYVLLRATAPSGLELVVPSDGVVVDVEAPERGWTAAAADPQLDGALPVRVQWGGWADLALHHYEVCVRPHDAPCDAYVDVALARQYSAVLPPSNALLYHQVCGRVGDGVLLRSGSMSLVPGGGAETRKRHQQEHRPQRPTERGDPTQHAEGRTGDCPGPRKETTTRRNVTHRGGGAL